MVWLRREIFRQAQNNKTELLIRNKIVELNAEKLLVCVYPDVPSRYNPNREPRSAVNRLLERGIRREDTEYGTVPALQVVVIESLGHLSLNQSKFCCMFGNHSSAFASYGRDRGEWLYGGVESLSRAGFVFD